MYLNKYVDLFGLIIPKIQWKYYIFGKIWHSVKELALCRAKASAGIKKRPSWASSLLLLLVCRVVVKVSLNINDWRSLVAGTGRQVT